MNMSHSDSAPISRPESARLWRAGSVAPKRPLFLDAISHLLEDEHKLFWVLHVGGWLAFGIVNFLSGLIHDKTPDYIVPTMAYVVWGLLVSLGLRYVYRALWQRPWWLIAAFALPALLMSGALFSSGQAIMYVNTYTTEWRLERYQDYLTNLPLALYLMLAWSGMYFGIKYYRMLQKQSEKALKATAMAHEAQVKMLRYQLNPHFLFNTLNAISTLILEGSDNTANAMVTRLSSFLRHSLYQHPAHRVSLKKELEALNLYLSIEKIRFPERLQVTQDISEDARLALVPSMILQPLIENAVKYAVAPREEGGHITIRAFTHGDQLFLSVCDDGPGCDPSVLFGSAEDDNAVGKGVGLRNSRERLRVLYGDAAGVDVRRLDPRGLCVTMNLPFERGSVDVAERGDRG